jgi:hypothetical protein
MKYTCLMGLIFMFLSFSGQAQEKNVFDHSNTGFDLTGGHSPVPCASCHIGGQFQGTPKECMGCHTTNGRINATAKPIQHIQASDRCETCHSTSAWQAVPIVDHNEVFGACFNCHNNIQVPGKPANHIPVQSDCNSCHTELSWQPVNFNHDFVGDNCFSCHNNVQAEGRPPQHIPILQPLCSNCHSNRQWVPVIRVDHTLLSDDCVSCHNGVIAKGQIPGHRPTGGTQCNTCHKSFNSFAEGMYEESLQNIIQRGDRSW